MAESTIRTVSIAELSAFYETKAWREGVRPISAQRALAQTHNPHADPQDVALLLAFEGTRCIGYLGLLPALAQAGERFAKVYWLSTWFVEPATRSTSAGALLLMRAMRLGYDLFASGMSDDSHAALKALRFPAMAPVRFHRIVLDRRLDHWTAPLRAMRRAIRMAGGDAGPIQRVVELVRARLNGLKQPLWRRLEAGLKEHASLRFVRTDRVEGPPGPSTDATTYGFFRGVEAVNWMLGYPWVPATRPCADDDYRFLARRDLFQHLAFQAWDGSSVSCGYATMLLSREFGVTTLRLLDTAVSVPSRCSELARLLVEQGRRHNADVLEMPSELAEIFSEMEGIGGLMQPVQLPCLYRLGSTRSPLHGVVERLEPRLTDGDLPFA